MDAVLYSILTLATQWMRPRYNARMQLLEAQIRMLRSRIDTSRIVPTPQERAELLRFGAAMDHDIEEVMHVVLPATYKKWLRQLRGPGLFGLLAGLGLYRRRADWFFDWLPRTFDGAIAESLGSSRSWVFASRRPYRRIR